MSDNIEKTELVGIIKSILKNDYPKYISKDFSKKIMSKIYASKNVKINSFFNYGIRIASAVSFAFITLFFIQNTMFENIEYSKSNIDEKIMSPTKNVINEIDTCDDNITKKEQDVSKCR
tara:strand:- start:261 stop:617 length:357 start_codon:yes stop_codon:yes gene_type:complete